MEKEELTWRKPRARPYGSVVGACVVDGELLGKVLEGEETVGGIETPLVLAVATLDLTIVSGCVRADRKSVV